MLASYIKIGLPSRWCQLVKAKKLCNYLNTQLTDINKTTSCSHKKLTFGRGRGPKYYFIWLQHISLYYNETSRVNKPSIENLFAT